MAGEFDSSTTSTKGAGLRTRSRTRFRGPAVPAALFPTRHAYQVASLLPYWWSEIVFQSFAVRASLDLWDAAACTLRDNLRPSFPRTPPTDLLPSIFSSRALCYI